MTKEMIAGPVKANKHRRLVSPLPDGKKHGLTYVQVETELNGDDYCSEVSFMFCRDFLDQLADKMNP